MVISGADAGITLRMHARLMAAVASCTTPKLTVIIGDSFGAQNYLMVGQINVLQMIT